MIPKLKLFAVSSILGPFQSIFEIDFFPLSNYNSKILFDEFKNQNISFHYIRVIQKNSNIKEVIMSFGLINKRLAFVNRTKETLYKCKGVWGQRRYRVYRINHFKRDKCKSC